jgi:hypothetical protein
MLSQERHYDPNSPVVITLTLPEPDHEATLLIQRGDLAHLRQFVYTMEVDFMPLIQQALAALVEVESNPPIIPEEPPRKTVTASPPPPQANPPEPMIQVPIKGKKGTRTVSARCLQILSGEADEAAQQQAVKVAGRLLDSGLWDGTTPIGIHDVYTVQLSLDGLTDKELKMLFTLEQFVQINPEIPATDAAQDVGDGLQTHVDMHNHQDTDKTLG